MKTSEFFQSKIDELLSDIAYYNEELKQIKVDPMNPILGMKRKKLIQDIISESEEAVSHFKKGLMLITNLEFKVA